MNKPQDKTMILHHKNFLENLLAKTNDVLKAREEVKNLCKKHFDESEKYYETVKANPSLDDLAVAEQEVVAAKAVFDAAWKNYQAAKAEITTINMAIKMADAGYNSTSFVGDSSGIFKN